MRKRASKSSVKVGAAPGTLVHTGERKIEQVQVTALSYNSEGVTEHSATTIEKALACCEGAASTWINVVGLHDTSLVSQLGGHFAIHPLTQEDILSTGQRPKWEDFGDYVYVVLRSLIPRPEDGSITSEQISLVLTPTVLISFQESAPDLFDPIRERLRKGQGRLRKSGCDYLAYALIDAVVDNYFLILERIGLEIDDIEEDTLARPNPKALQRMHDLKRQVITLRKQVWPLREVIAGLSREGSALITPATSVFLRDVGDHAIQIIDTIETYRDLLSGLLDLYLSMVSNKMNEIMKVLTIVSTLFIPLTFLTGVYGMNFKYMPELEWKYGYALIWLLITVVALTMILFIKKKKWV
jgi:magnesium transporter